MSARKGALDADALQQPTRYEWNQSIGLLGSHIFTRPPKIFILKKGEKRQGNHQYGGLIMERDSTVRLG